MKRLSVSLAAILVATTLIVVGCTQTAAPVPTSVPAATTKAAEVTKPVAESTKPAAASTPTQAALKKTDYPTNGKTLNVIVPYPAGGSSDVFSRMVAEPLEKALGIPNQIVNKGGAGAQIGITELAAAKPDGYTIGLIPLPTTSSIYLDPARQATFKPASFAPIALLAFDPLVVAVKDDSPYKTLKDLVDGAKANPDKVKVAVTGIQSTSDLGRKVLQEVTQAPFARVQFEGGAEVNTAILGGHVEFRVDMVSDVLSHVVGGQMRVLAVLDKQPNRFFPNVTTAESQGFKVYAQPGSRIFSAPAGTPPEIVDALANAMKKVTETPELKAKADKLGFDMRYLGPADTVKYWADADLETERLMK